MQTVSDQIVEFQTLAEMLIDELTRHFASPQSGVTFGELICGGKHPHRWQRSNTRPAGGCQITSLGNPAKGRRAG